MNPADSAIPNARMEFLCLLCLRLIFIGKAFLIQGFWRYINISILPNNGRPFNLNSLTFREFLLACGEDHLLSVLDKNVRAIQNKLLYAYENDLSKHAPGEIVTKIRMLWNSIPTQLAKENKKFLYGLIREGARAGEYEVAITWLLDTGLVYKINRAKKPDFPLRAYQDFSAFKLFVLDIGLLGAMSRLNAKIILEGNRLFEEFKGALMEQYVLQQLLVNPENDIFYWTAENATAELDFLIQTEEKIIPMEVKVEENLRAKSLRVFAEKYDSKQHSGCNLHIFSAFFHGKACT